MVDLLSRSGRLNAAYDLIQSMPVEPHAGAWGALLGACKLNGNIELGELEVNDVLMAIDHVIDLGLASPSKLAVLGGSHGGFLTTHLIGQAQDKFVAAAARNPVCNLTLMVGTTDIPDWAYGSEGQNSFTDAPSAEHLTFFQSKSPIALVSKVKTPTLFLLGAQDLRVPVSTGLQYARALKEKGVPIKVIVFPNDTHAIERLQSDFESFLSIVVILLGEFDAFAFHVFINHHDAQ
ncbi:acylamino-acid-releasing enzyme-like [Prunus yedoensis var. nudiflora]|uniref:Acylamino-acid-releasing enzyme-like n=1 Tax=Prunus yedoensis var. nudiflora TaxID=2094558 RepID=A0A314ZIR0_PRUYE|nr:acylamino-acid-releasing enzyme-like [Prunus yedoensis var. nudiflora]